MFKKIPWGSIDWHGVKRVFVHALLLGLGYLASQGEATITAHNWGVYEPLVMAANTVVFTFIEKLFTTYGTPIPPYQQG